MFHLSALGNESSEKSNSNSKTINFLWVTKKLIMRTGHYQESLRLRRLRYVSRQLSGNRSETIESRFTKCVRPLRRIHEFADATDSEYAMNDSFRESGRRSSRSTPELRAATTMNEPYVCDAYL